LAVGCLFTEGLIEKASEITGISVNNMTVRVEVGKNVSGPPPRARSSGFGLGSVAVGGLSGPTLSRTEAPRLTAERIIELMETFNRRSDLFRQTGAVHSACLVTGGLEYFAEDVGRHNALDKVIGRYLMGGPTGEPGLMLTTGRISTEILLKSAKAGLGAVISRSAATDRAVELARKLNMIMIGFSRRNRFNIYSGEEMILRDQPGI
jgi:FdhD protein